MARSVFNVDRSDLLRNVLDKLNVRYRERRGWQQIQCPNTVAHSHGDRNPSCAVNLGYGKIHCHACGLRGDGFDLAHLVAGKTPQQVLDWLGQEVPEQESEWLI